MTTATATLIQHRAEGDSRKTYSVELDAVRSAPVPENTETWFPISHANLLDEVEASCDQRGLIITERKYALNKSRSQFLGTFMLAGRDDIARDFQLAMGIRNSTDKTLPAGLCAGAKVFVCDNSSFSGEVTLARRHTKHILADLPRLVARAVDGFLTAAVDQARTFNHWKTIDVTADQAGLLAIDAAEHGALPSNGILAVRREFITPRHTEFLSEGRHTAWTLYNAFTQYLTHDREAVSPIKAQRDFLRVHRTLAEAFPVAAPCLN